MNKYFQLASADLVVPNQDGMFLTLYHNMPSHLQSAIYSVGSPLGLYYAS
jgi:hypothetical protein